MKAALDTDALAYAEGIDSVEKRDIVLELVGSLPQKAIVIPVQVRGELFKVLVRKAGRRRAEARRALLGRSDAFSVVGTAPEAMPAAADIATDHHLGIWDAVILAVASQAGCRLLLSEDMQGGFTWGGVTVVNPFASPRHVLLASLLDESLE